MVDSINNVNNIYCLILYNGKAIGLINDKDMDWHKEKFGIGLFVWDKDCVKKQSYTITCFIMSS